MSLRLPSQNKFKPVARPVPRKPGGPPGARPPGARPPPNAASSSQSGAAIAPRSSQAPASSTTASGFKAPSAPQPKPTTPSTQQAKTVTTPGSALHPSGAGAPPGIALRHSASPAPVPRPVVGSSSATLDAAARSALGAGVRPSPSSRAPSASPAPKAPSVAPSPAPRPRASSIARPRASATPQPAPRPPTPASANVYNPPAHAPSPAPPRNAFPPSLATSSGPSFPVPPPLATTSPREPTTESSAQALSAASLAAAAVQSINDARPSMNRGVKRRAPRRAKADKPSKLANPPARRAALKRKASDQAGPASQQDGSSDEDMAESTRGTSVAATDVDGEDTGSISSRTAKQARKKRGPAVAVISLHAVQPGEMVGREIDPSQVTMGDLATVLAAEGRVSQNAVQIDALVRAEQYRKKEARAKATEEKYKRQQIVRRKVRAQLNAAREARREAIRESGGDVMDVSADEDDTDEEFEHTPERLTPESTPEPDALGRARGRGRGGSEERLEREGGEESDVETVDGDPNAPLVLDPVLDVGSAAGSPQPSVRASASPVPDEDDADFARYGFHVTDDPDAMDSDERRQQEMQENLANYRLSNEQQLRDRLASIDRQDEEVVEIDKATTFVNNATYAKKKRPLRWSRVETELFYQILGETGENFTLMQAYFPERDRHSLKLKANVENRRNPQRMNDAIMRRTPIDKAYLTKAVGYDATRPWDKERALFQEAQEDKERLHRQHTERLEEEAMEREENGLGGEEGLMRIAEDVKSDEEEKDDEEYRDGKDEGMEADEGYAY